jgi:hypothetical protein
MTYTGDVSLERRIRIQNGEDDEFSSVAAMPVDVARVFLEQASKEAQEAQLGRKCLFCGKYAFCVPYSQALIEGHCYSEGGMRDMTRITQVCEFCFDEACARDEENALDYEEGEWDDDDHKSVNDD